MSQPPAKRARRVPPAPVVTEIVMDDGVVVRWSDRVVALNGQTPRVLRDRQTYIGRANGLGGWRLAASPLANPFSVAQHGRDDALRRYYDYAKARPHLVDAAAAALAAGTLCCWCHRLRDGAPDPRTAGLCHGDVLVALVDARAAVI
jgi:hypothetical protein